MLLPHVIAFNYDACEERYKAIAEVMHLTEKKEDTKDNIKNALQNLLTEMQFPVLKDYCNDLDMIEKLSYLAVKDKCTRINAKQIKKDDAFDIYKNAMKR